MHYLARMVRMASEDIRLAEPAALAVTLAAKDAFDFLGSARGHLALTPAANVLSLAPNRMRYTDMARSQDVHDRSRSRAAARETR
jgi:replication-associated recombination protein RarA